MSKPKIKIMGRMLSKMEPQGLARVWLYWISE